MRVVSLIAGITLLVDAGIAGLLGRRDQLGAERDRQLATTAELTAAQLDETLARISAVLTVATADTDVDQLGRCRSGSPSAPSTPTARSAHRRPTVAAAAIEAALGAATGAGRPVVVVAAADGRAGDRRRRRHRPGRAPAARQHDARRLRPARRDERRPRAGRRRAAAASSDGRGRPLVRRALDRRVRGRPVGRAHDDAGDRPADDRGALADRRPARGRRRRSPILALGGMVAEHRVLQRRATTDALTGLPNRAEFERRAIETLARLGRDGGQGLPDGHRPRPVQARQRHRRPRGRRPRARRRGRRGCAAPCASRTSSGAGAATSSSC